jgi:predicted anti-sigma-YlaC factor YlaD
VGRLSIECERARLWASLAADAEITELEQAGLEAHLRDCFECRAHAERLRGVAALVRGLPLEEPGRPLLPAPRRHRYGRLQLVASAAAVAAALALGSLAGALSSRGGSSAAPQKAATHRLQIEQSLLALMAGAADQSRPHGRVIPS